MTLYPDTISSDNRLLAVYFTFTINSVKKCFCVQFFCGNKGLHYVNVCEGVLFSKEKAWQYCSKPWFSHLIQKPNLKAIAWRAMRNVWHQLCDGFRFVLRSTIFFMLLRGSFLPVLFISHRYKHSKSHGYRHIDIFFF